MCKSSSHTSSKSCPCFSSTTLRAMCLSPTWSSFSSSSFQCFGKGPETSTHLFDYSRRTFHEDHNRYIICDWICVPVCNAGCLTFRISFGLNLDLICNAILNRNSKFIWLSFRLSRATSWSRCWACSRSWSRRSRTITKDSTCSSLLSSFFRPKLSLDTSNPFSLW